MPAVSTPQSSSFEEGARWDWHLGQVHCRPKLLTAEEHRWPRGWRLVPILPPPSSECDTVILSVDWNEDHPPLKCFAGTELVLWGNTINSSRYCGSDWGIIVTRSFNLLFNILNLNMETFTCDALHSSHFRNYYYFALVLRQSLDPITHWQVKNEARFLVMHSIHVLICLLLRLL